MTGGLYVQHWRQVARMGLCIGAVSFGFPTASLTPRPQDLGDAQYLEVSLLFCWNWDFREQLFLYNFLQFPIFHSKHL